jgi:hypothetical protein
MGYRTFSAMLAVAMVSGSLRPASIAAQDPAGLAGRWTLNRALSQTPSEIGFDVDWLAAGGSGQESTAGGGRGRRGSGGAVPGAFPARRESEDDARRVQQLTEEARNPPARLTIVDTPAAVTLTDESGKLRTFHTDGKEEVLQLDGVPVAVTAKREAGRVSVLYQVEQGRELRYTYSRVVSPPRLVVDVQFLERGRGDAARRVYEPSTAADSVAPSRPASATTQQGTAAPPAATTPGAGLPASAGRLPGETFNQQPDAELKGLTKLGIVVEGLSPQAAACGLKEETLEAALSKRLSDAGFKVLQNSDEDSYVYVNIMTTSLSTGLCVSRYDVSVFTHTTARLSYQDAPVLVQVSLLHKGGIAGGPAAAHAESVLRGVQEYVDQFATRIRDANK